MQGYDIYRPSISDELQRYFDAYCKPESTNGPQDWEESTPRVRLSLLGFEGDGSPASTVIERPETSYPLERQKLRTLYLNAETGELAQDKPNQETIGSYEGRSLNDQLVSQLCYNVERMRRHWFLELFLGFLLVTRDTRLD